MKCPCCELKAEKIETCACGFDGCCMCQIFHLEIAHDGVVPEVEDLGGYPDPAHDRSFA